MAEAGDGKAITGLSFAIPIDNAMLIYSKLKKDKTVDYAWLGVGIYSLTDPNVRNNSGITREHGALINSIIQNSPADNSDLKVGDIIIGVNDQEIKDANELIWAISKYNPGDKVKLTYISGDKTKTVYITLSKRPDSKTLSQTTPQDDNRSQSYLGAYFSDIDAATAKKLKLKNTDGVIITKFDTVSTARDYSLMEGDIVKKINTKEIKNIKDIEKFFEEADKNNVKSYFFYIIRDGRDLIVGVER